MYMEDLNTTFSDILDTIYNDLGIDENDDDTYDLIYNTLMPVLEKLAGYPDYRNYN